MKTKKLDKRTMNFNKKNVNCNIRNRVTKSQEKRFRMQLKTMFDIAQIFTAKNIVKFLKKEKTYLFKFKKMNLASEMLIICETILLNQKGLKLLLKSFNEFLPQKKERKNVKKSKKQ
jgi:hypothetical protein